MQDREVAYEQNVTGLEIAWRERIEGYAASAVSKLAREFQDDTEGLRLEATQLVEVRLFDSLQWENVNATDISDISYEAVSKEIDSRR